jgi:DNA-binding LacI/PurR family transcriptional regulator
MRLGEGAFDQIVAGLPVAGFNDCPIAHQTPPTLTTLRLPLNQIGAALCDMLIELIEGMNHLLRQMQRPPV